MYGPLWRALPGRWPFKLVQICLLVVAVVAICFVWLFPAFAPHLPFNENTVGNSQDVGQGSRPNAIIWH